MPTIETFGHHMIEASLKKRGLKYLRDNDGDFRLEYGYDDDTGCEWTVWMIAGGKQKDVLDVRVVADKKFEKSQWGVLVMLCNESNTERRWPKASLCMSDPWRGQIMLQCAVDMETGTHQEFVDDFIQTALGAAYQFWKWMHTEKGY